MIQNALFLGRKKLSTLTVPWGTYTDPEVAHGGIHEHEAKQRGLTVDTFCRPMSAVDQAVTDGETEGFVRILVARGSDRIFGATIVARHAGEMISEVSVAMTARGSRQTRPGDPPLSEAGRGHQAMRRRLQSHPLDTDGQKIVCPLAGMDRVG